MTRMSPDPRPTAGRSPGAAGRRRGRSLAGRLVPVAALAVVAACGGGGSTTTTLPGSAPSGTTAPSGSAPGTSKGEITVASANFTESAIIAEMYAGALEKAGYTVSKKLNLGTREVYLKAAQAGEIDVLPEYVAALAEGLNLSANGKDAEPLGGADPKVTITKMTPLLDAAKLSVFGLSEAQDQNAYAVTPATAQRLSLKTLTDLGKVSGQLTFGGPPTCQTRPQCLPGLAKAYGVKFKAFKTLDAGGPLTITAIKNGDIDVGLVFTSDGAVAANKLTVLEDDKGITPAENIIALARTEAATDDVKAALTAVNEALTTEKLSELNRKVGIDKEDPAAVAKQFLTDEQLA